MDAASTNWIYQIIHPRSSSRSDYYWPSTRAVKDLVLVKGDEVG